MAGFWTTLASLAAAGAMMVTGAVNEAAPQHNVQGDTFLINRQWRVSRDWVPELRATRVPGQVRDMRPDAAACLEEMYAACLEETGMILVDISGYRSYGKQSRIYSNKLRRVGGKRAKADEYVARPGASEHQLGLAMDVGQRGGKGNLGSAFGKTRGGIWLRDNCWRFGFILRYQQGWEDITGYRYEPWHVRYVGKENARLLREAGVPLETWLLAQRESVLLRLVAVGE